MSENKLMEQRSKDANFTIAMALKACIRPDAWAHGSIVARVYAYQVKRPNLEKLQVSLFEIIEESNRRAMACPWVE